MSPGGIRLEKIHCRGSTVGGFLYRVLWRESSVCIPWGVRGQLGESPVGGPLEASTGVPLRESPLWGSSVGGHLHVVTCRRSSLVGLL
jgi:hypothetical protein